jgi:hypothetical protein
MPTLEELVARAKTRDNYVDPGTLSFDAPVRTSQPAFNPRPNFGSTGNTTSTVSSPNVGLSPETLRLKQRIASGQLGSSNNNDSSLLGEAAGLAGKGFMEIIKAADTGKRLYQGVAAEYGDLVAGTVGQIPGVGKQLAVAANLAGNPFQLRGVADESGNRDTNFDFGEIRTAVTAPDAIGTGFLDRTTWTEDLPGFIKPIVGFAGDIATDPVTYLSFGTLSGANAAAKSGLAAGRAALAKNTSKAIDAAILAGKSVDDNFARKIVTEAGKRGRGAFTPKGLKRIGATQDDIAQLGFDPKWRTTVGVGRKRVSLPGTARVAAKAEDLKGSIKAFTGGSHAGKIFREMFTSAKYGEAALKQQVLSGARTAPEAARLLSQIEIAKGETFHWFDRMVGAATKLEDTDAGVKLSGMGETERRALTHALEIGDFNHPLVKQVSGWFDQAADDLLKFGSDFTPRKRYVPHRLTDKARRLYDSGADDPMLREIMDPTMKKSQSYQKVRQGDQTIAEINQAWRASGHDFDLLEDDIHKLMVAYLDEGQQGAMRGLLTGDAARAAGMVDDLTPSLNTKKLDKTISKYEDDVANNITKAVKSRTKSLSKAKTAATVERRRVSQVLKEAKDRISRAETNSLKATKAYNDALVKLDALQVAEKQTARLAKNARGAEKRSLTIRLKELGDEKLAMRQQLTTAKTRYTKAIAERGRLAEELKGAQAEWDQIQSTIKSLSDERAAMDAAPIGKTAVKAQQEADKAAEVVARQRDAVVNAKDDYDVAANTSAWVGATQQDVVDSASDLIARLDEWKSLNANMSMKSGRKGSAERVAFNDVLRSRLDEIRAMIPNTTDPSMQAVLKAEARELAADAKAFLADAAAGELKSLRSQFNQGVDVLSNPLLRDMIDMTTRDGMRVLKRQVGDDLQINAWYDDMISTMDRFTDPRTRGPAWRGAKRAIDAYAKGLNWWKGWALATPGFVVRNFETGLFAMYLDDVSPIAATRFWRFLKNTENMADDQALNFAVGKYGKQQANNLMEARKIAAASGWGQTQGEFAQTLARGATNKNPLSVAGPIAGNIRKASSEVESFLRGGHAFAVLEKGGTYTDALERVQKFHFNYRDISTFDRNAKMAMPFYTFWSRNLGLQAQVFAKKPSKISRSFYNAKRNMEDGTDNDWDLPIPKYLSGAMAGIPLPFSLPGGQGQTFVTPDIPSFQFKDQVESLANNPFKRTCFQLGAWA